MPTIEISKKDLEGLVGKKFSNKELEDALLFVKGEVDAVEGDKISVDVKETNRPDLWSTEGMARELRARLGIEKGIPKIVFGKPAIEVIVDPQTEGIRPKVAAALVKNAKISQEFLEQLIQLQEKIAQTFGRKRKEAAIGLYEIDKLTPPIHYKAFSPSGIKFVPLEFETEMTLQEILEMHPKGKEYGHLLSGYKKYPVWIDSKGVVASLSPVINSEITGKISTNTKNVFIEVSGFDQETVNTALLVMAGAFHERGAKVLKAKIRYKKQAIETPVFETKKASIGLDYINKISGLELAAKQAVELLGRARYDAKAKGKKIEASYPNYRKDILHPVDIVEDILISIGFNNINPMQIQIPLRGEKLEATKLVEMVREACIGLGLQEILSLTLTSKEKQAGRMGLKEDELVEIENPMSQNYSVFRKNILPEALEFLSKNKKSPFPQKIFEIGKTIELDGSKETGVSEKDTLCIVLSGKNSDFTSAKSHLEGICNALGEKYTLKEAALPFLEKGKSAEILIGGKKGFVGEISQKTLKEFQIDEKTAIVEMQLE